MVFRGMARHMEAFRTWNDDGYLREKFANVQVDIEEGKKENRSLGKMYFMALFRTGDGLLICRYRCPWTGISVTCKK